MTFDLQDTHQEYTNHGRSYDGESEQEAGLRLDILIEDSESITLEQSARTIRTVASVRSM